MANNIDQLG